MRRPLAFAAVAAVALALAAAGSSGDGYYTGQHGSLVATFSTLEFNVTGTTVEVGGLTPGAEYDTRTAFYPDTGGYPTYRGNATVNRDGDLYYRLGDTLDLRHGEYVTSLTAEGGHTPATGPDGQPLRWAFRIPTTYLQYP